MTKKVFRLSVFAALFASVLTFTSCEDEDNDRTIGNWINVHVEFPGTQRGDAVCFKIGNTAYVGTGVNTALTVEKERFRDFYACTASGEDLSWTSGSMWDYNGQGVSSMPEVDNDGNPVEARNGAVAFALNGKGYVGLGYSGYHYLKDFWEFDPQGSPDPAQYPTIYSKMAESDKANFGKNADGTPTGKWTKVADFPGDSCVNAIAFVLKGADGVSRAYVGGGQNFDANSLNAFYKFDGQKWTTAPAIKESRYLATAFTYEMDGKEYGYVFGGMGASGAVKLLERFDPVTETWQSMQRLSDATHDTFDDDYDALAGYGGVSFVLGDKAYVTTGGPGGVGTYTWEYDFAGDFWLQMTGFPSARTLAVAFTLEHEATSWRAQKWAANGKQTVPYVVTGSGQLVSGTTGGGTFYKDCYLFNPYQAHDSRDDY